MDVDQLKPLLIARLPGLRRFARTLTSSPADADDLVQDACLRALERSAGLRDASRLDGWMYRLLRNTWLDELRRRRVRAGAGRVDAEETDELRTETDGAAHLDAAGVADQILGLPDGMSSVVLLVSIEGYTYREAADILGIPIGTVMSRMSRARQTIADALGQIAEGPGG